MSRQIVSTPDPTLCPCGSQTASGSTMGGPWTCDRCGKALALGGPPVGNISIRVDEAQDWRVAEAMRAGWSEEKARLLADAHDRCHGMVSMGGILRAVGNPIPSMDDFLAALMRGYQPTGIWIPEEDWRRLPELAQQSGEYVFAAPKPTGLARRLQRRRKT